MNDFVKHPLIKPNLLQSRAYQEAILAKAIEKNLLCVLPTGLGKTPISILLTAHRLGKFPKSKILVLSPTKPLTVQHYNTFLKFLDIDKSEFQVLTGLIKPKEREDFYKKKKLIFATPQTVKNDLEQGRLSLRDFSLLTIDEIHHSIGRYAYPYVARRYLKEAVHPRILGLTASPGATREKINEICKNTGIEAVEIRTERDKDVVPYIKEKRIEWVNVELPESFEQIRKLIKEVYKDKIEKLKKFGFFRSKPVTKKNLLELQAKLRKSIDEGYKKAFTYASLVAQAIKLGHAVELIETQGVTHLEEYWKKLRQDQTRAARAITNDKKISDAIYLTNELIEKGCKHPKISKLCSIIDKELSLDPNSRIIIFANYRSTVKEIVSILKNIQNAKPIEFLGQREGMTQKEQIRRIDAFGKGEYNILTCTSIGEEGLDILEASLAVFYEPVPSPLRSIQRRGRVGRASIGKVIILITKRTRDEAYYWSAYHKEKRMKGILFGMKKGKIKQKEKQISLKDF